MESHPRSQGNRKAPPNSIQDQSDVYNLQGKRKAPPKLMGGASSKDTIVIDSPIAAVFSILCNLQYGREVGDDNDASVASEDAQEVHDSNDKDDYMPNGLVFLDDEDFLIDVDLDSEDKRL